MNEEKRIYRDLNFHHSVPVPHFNYAQKMESQHATQLKESLDLLPHIRKPATIAPIPKRQEYISFTHPQLKPVRQL